MPGNLNSAVTADDGRGRDDRREAPGVDNSGSREGGPRVRSAPKSSSRGASAMAGEDGALLLNADTYSQLLLARFAVFNLAAVALLAGTWVLGWPQRVVEADASGLTLVIAVVFAAGWLLCLWRLAKISFELTCANHGSCKILNHYLSVMLSRDAATARRALELRLFGRIAFVRHVADSLVLLGLIGTVLGFIHAFAGMDGGVVSDTGKASEVIAAAMQGMSIALYTTLIGTIANVWLMACYRMLETGAANLAALVFEA